jgi:riboflavin kinase/FMN adenylyltransferase
MELGEETPIELEFLVRLRGEIQWPSPEALKTQIMRDIGAAKRCFRLIKG